MRKIIKDLKENKQDFIERVNITMMNDFASEFMKTEDDKITISYLIFQYDVDDMVDIDYLFDWRRTKERVNNWYQIDVIVNRDDWIAWVKARACENDWVILDKRQGIYNTTTGDFINGKECLNDDFLRQLKPKHFIRYILANEIKQINADLKRLNSWINNSRDNGLKT